MSHTISERARRIADTLCLIETEESWDRIAAALKSLEAMFREDGPLQNDDYITMLRTISSSLNKYINSERSRLSGAALDMLSTAATEIGQSFETLLPLFLPTIITLCGRPNKIFVARARACINAFIESTQSPQILSYLLRHAKDKSATLRLAVAEATLACLQSFNPPDLQRDARGQEVETLIKLTATDANAEIRKVGRKIFEAYSILLPSRVDRFVAPLTPTIRKYLAVTTRSVSTTSSNPPSRPSSSMSSHSTLALSQSSSLVTEHTKVIRPVKRGEASTASSQAPSSRSSASQAIAVAGPSRTAHTPKDNIDTHPQRPASRTESSRCNLMPPPSKAPTRSRSDNPLLAQDLKPVATSSSMPSHSMPSFDPIRPRSGPIRPTGPSQQDAAPSAHLVREGQAEHRRNAGGARRVLRPEPAMITQLSEEEPKSASSTSNVAAVQPTGDDPQQPPPNRRLRDKHAATTKDSRAPPKLNGTKVKPAIRARETDERPSKTAPLRETRSKGAPPSSAVHERQRSRFRNGQLQSASGKLGQAMSMTSQKFPTATKPKLGPIHTKGFNAAVDLTARRAVSPALIPLPQSPTESLPSTPTQHSSPLLQESRTASKHDHIDALPSNHFLLGKDRESCEVSEEPAGILDPSTPDRKTTVDHEMLVQQTPISALVESIQRGFMFTPSTTSLSAVDEDEYDEDSILCETQTEPVTWDCKPLALSKTL